MYVHIKRTTVKKIVRFITLRHILRILYLICDLLSKYVNKNQLLKNTNVCNCHYKDY